MFLLNEITLPFSYNYSNVLQLISIIANSILYFYLFWLTGTALLTFYLEYIKKDDQSKQLSQILNNFPLKKFSFPLVLGFIPFFVIYSVDLIWLTRPEFAEVHNWTLVNFVIFILSTILLYLSNSKSKFISLLTESGFDARNTKIEELILSTRKKKKNYGLFGLLGILISLFLFSLISVAKLDYTRGDFRFDLLGYLFEINVYIKFLYNIIAAFSLTFIAFLFFSLAWKDEEVNLVTEVNKNFQITSLRAALISVLLQPLLILLELILLPTSSLSNLVFLSSGLAVILLFLILNQLNAYTKETINSYLRMSFYIFVFVLITISVRDVVALGNVMKPVTVEIAQKFVAYEGNLKEKLNIKTVSINAEEIFTVKCAACHQFETKLVGPPYNAVLKKYENNRDQLVRFILNPVKVDPSYPPMPAQGLIPTEAEAVADYLLKIYNEKHK